MIGLIWLAVFLRLHQLDQTPPGLYHDEAFYTLDAQHLLEYGRWLIFYPGNNGREPLHIYLLAGAQWLLGDRTWAVRLVSAFSGTLAVPLIYCLGRALWRGAGQHSRWVGLLAAGSLAVSYWDVNFSRTAFRNIHLVAVSILAVWLLWRGAQQRSRRLIALSGVALGLSLYIYLAARVFPAVFLGLALALVLIGWRFGGLPLRAALRQPLVAGSLAALAVAAVVCLPLGAYFALHPDQFSERSGGLSVLSPAPAAAPATGASQPPPNLAGNIVATVRMFVDRGDANARHNLPGRPAVDWVGQIGLLAGLGTALWQLRQPRSVLLLGWLVTMLLPTTLSIEAPHFLRAIGALPPLCLLVAGGLAALWQPLMAAQPKLAAAGWPALLVGVVAISGSLTYRDYFLRWAPAPATADAFDSGPYTVAERALDLSQTNDVVLPLRAYVEPAALARLEPVFRRLAPMDAAVGDPRPAVLLAPAGADLSNLVLLRRLPGQAAQALVLPPLDPQAARELAQQPASGRVSDLLGRPVAAEVPGIERWLPAAPASTPLDATLGGLVRLAGADSYPSTPQRGDEWRIDLHWVSLNWLPEDDDIFMQLQNPAGDNLEQRDSLPLEGSYPTTLWVPGSNVTDPYTLTVPTDLAPGTYRVIAGLRRPSGERLPITGTHDVLPDSVVVGHLYLPDPALNLGAITHPTTITGGEPVSLKLVGYDLAANTLAAGSSLNLTLYWQDLAPLALDYTVFVHVTDSAGQVRAQADAQPLGGRAPTSWWRPGELFRDPRTVSLGSDLPPGSYSLSVGLYDLATGERLPLLAASGQRLSDDQALLGALTVTGPQP